MPARPCSGPAAGASCPHRDAVVTTPSVESSDRRIQTRICMKPILFSPVFFPVPPFPPALLPVIFIKFILQTGTGFEVVASTVCGKSPNLCCS